MSRFGKTILDAIYWAAVLLVCAFPSRAARPAVPSLPDRFADGPVMTVEPRVAVELVLPIATILMIVRILPVLRVAGTP